MRSSQPLLFATVTVKKLVQNCHQNYHQQSIMSLAIFCQTFRPVSE